jgi:hypothetical protein
LQFPMTEWTPQTQTSPVLADLLQMCDVGLKDILGAMADPADIAPSNVSGHAIDLMQHAQDARTYIYTSNLEIAMQRSGEVFLSMVRDAMVEEGREETTVDASGQASTTVLNQPTLIEGKKALKNDITKAKYRVVAQAGPSSSSRRAAAAKSFGAMAQMATDPQMKTTLESLAVMNMEGEGISDVHQWVRKNLVQSGVLQPTEEEQAQMEEAAKNQEPDPQAAYLQAAAQNQLAQAQAKTAETAANTALKEAQAEGAKADAAKTLHDIEGAKLDRLLAMLDQLLQPPAAQETTPSASSGGVTAAQ